MQKVIFVIGMTAAGKSYFIEENYGDKDIDILNIYDYQQRAYDEAGFGDVIPFGAEFRCLYAANNMLLQDVIDKLLQGRNVVVEQTFYKAKRRIAYIDEIRKVANVDIEVYVMSPSKSRWQANLEKRNLKGRFQAYKSSTDEIEFPNVAEGIDKIYEVVDGKVKLRMDKPRPEILEVAREELLKEAERICDEDKERKKHMELLESMKVRPFWHYCEVCGKKEYITAQQAMDSGWDYPPHMGHFGLLGPRTCGNCLLEDTLFWKVNTEKKIPIPVVVEGMLKPKEKVTWKRIKAEPESLIYEEEK